MRRERLLDSHGPDCGHGTVHDIDAVPEDMRRVVRDGADIVPEWYVRMQAAYQKFTDDAVSKTVNSPTDATGRGRPRVYEYLAHGSSASRESRSMAMAPEEGSGVVDGKTCEQSGRCTLRATRRNPPRPQASGHPAAGLRRSQTGCGNVYVTVNWDEKGMCELFTRWASRVGVRRPVRGALAGDLGLACAPESDSGGDRRQPSRHSLPEPEWAQGGKVLSCADAVGHRTRALRSRGVEDGSGPAVSLQARTIGPRLPLRRVPERDGAVEHECGCHGVSRLRLQQVRVGRGGRGALSLGPIGPQPSRRRSRRTSVRIEPSDPDDIQPSSVDSLARASRSSATPAIPT